MDLEIGSVIFSKFEILEKIGAGGKGSIFKALDQTLKRLVVIKVPNSKLDPKAMVRFQNEAKLLGRLKHPNIATVYDFGVNEDGDAYIAIDFVDGRNLAQLVAERGPLPADLSLDILRQVCEAVRHAHAEGVIHRDIKPENIMLIEEGEGTYHAVLLDFGVAKLASDSDQSELNLTKQGAIVGSPLFMSPEQAAGKGVTKASDRYALGCVFYFMLSAHPPFEGESALEVLSGHLEKPIPRLYENTVEPFEEQCDVLIERLLAKEPSDRFESTDELLTAVSQLEEALLEPVTASANDCDESAQFGKPSSSFKKMAVAVSLSACVILMMATGLLNRASRETKAPEVHVPEPVEGNSSFVEGLIARKATTIELPDIRDDDLKLLKGYPYLQVADFSGCSNLTDQGIRYLTECPIIVLKAKSTGLKTLKHVAKIKSLRELHVSDTSVNDESVKNIKDLPMLGVLRVEATEVTNDCLQYLKEIRCLRHVDVSQTAVTDDALASVSKQRPACAFKPGHEQSPVLVDAFRHFTEQRYALAKKEFALAIAEVERVQGKDAPILAELLWLKASCCKTPAERDEATALVLRAVAIAGKNDNYEKLAEAYNMLAGHYWLKQRYDESFDAREQAAKFYALSQGKYCVNVQLCLNALATGQQFIGREQDANASWKRLLEVTKTRTDGQGAEYANTLVQVGLSESRLLRDQEAYDCLYEAYEIFKKLGPERCNKHVVATTLQYLSRTTQKIRDVETALKYAELAATFVRQHGLEAGIQESYSARVVGLRKAIENRDLRRKQMREKRRSRHNTSE